MEAKKFPEPQPFTDRERPQIALEPVESNQVGAIGYDPATKTLAVQFKRGASADLQPGASRAARTERGYRKMCEALEKGAAEHAAAGAK